MPTQTVLADVLGEIARELRDEIIPDSEMYCLVDIGKVFANMGINDDAELYERVYAVIPLKRNRKGASLYEVDGNDFNAHAQLESGIVVRTWVAEKSGLPHKKYEPKARMILNG